MAANAVLLSGWELGALADDTRLLDLTWMSRAEKARRWTGVLAELAQDPSPAPAALNAFDYVFLVEAKNADLFVSETAGSFREEEPELRRRISALENLERDGEPLPADMAELGRLYLGDRTPGGHRGLRTVVLRTSARDERRILASLLCRGPATVQDLVAELGVPESLVQRLLAAVAPAVESRARDGRTFWLIREDALAGVLFVVRETMGLDPLASLAR